MKIPFGGTLVLCLAVLSGCQTAQWQQSLAFQKLWPGSRFPHQDEPKELVNLATAQKPKTTEAAAANSPSGNKPASAIQQVSHAVADDGEISDRDSAAVDGATAAIERGHALLRQGRLDQARDEYQKVLQSDPGNVEAHHRLAVIADQKKDFAAAESHYSQAMQKTPNDADLLSDLGYSYLLQGRRRESETALRLALEIAPGHPYASNNLKLLSDSNGKQPGAQQTPSFGHAATNAPGVASQPVNPSEPSGSQVTVTAPGEQVLKPLDAPWPGSAAESRPPAIIRGTKLSVSVTDPLTQIRNAQSAGPGQNGTGMDARSSFATNNGPPPQMPGAQTGFSNNFPRINPGGSPPPVDPNAAAVQITPRGVNNPIAAALQQQRIASSVQPARTGPPATTQFAQERIPTARLTPDVIPYTQTYQPQSSFQNDASGYGESNGSAPNSISSVSRMGGTPAPLTRTAANPLDSMSSWPPQQAAQPGYGNATGGLMNEPGLIAPPANGNGQGAPSGQPDWSLPGGPQSSSARPNSNVQTAGNTTNLQTGRGPVIYADANYPVPAPPFPTDARGAREAAMAMGMNIGSSGAFLPEQGSIAPPDGEVQHADGYSNAFNGAPSASAGNKTDFSLQPGGPPAFGPSGNQGGGQTWPAPGYPSGNAANSTPAPGRWSVPSATPSWGQQMPASGQNNFTGRNNVPATAPNPAGSNWGTAVPPSGSSWGNSGSQSFVPSR